MSNLASMSFTTIVSRTEQMKKEITNRQIDASNYQKYTYFVFGFGALLLIYKFIMK